jgi:hypothetical protein
MGAGEEEGMTDEDEPTSTESVATCPECPHAWHGDMGAPCPAWFSHPEGDESCGCYYASDQPEEWEERT